MSTQVLNANETLQGFNGANQTFRNPMYNFVYTDGVRDFTKANNLFWFLTLIASHQNSVCWIKNGDLHVKTVLNQQQQPFQVWKLERELVKNGKGEVVERKDSFLVSCSDGNGFVLKTQHVEFSDFPFDLYTVWLQEKVLLLPEEY